MPLQLDTLYTFKYPEDFKQIQFRQNGKQSMAMLLPSVLHMNSPFSVVSSIAFDVHMADFQLDLFSFSDVDDD